MHREEKITASRDWRERESEREREDETERGGRGEEGRGVQEVNGYVSVRTARESHTAYL